MRLPRNASSNGQLHLACYIRRALSSFQPGIEDLKFQKMTTVEIGYIGSMRTAKFIRYNRNPIYTRFLPFGTICRKNLSDISDYPMYQIIRCNRVRFFWVLLYVIAQRIITSLSDDVMTIESKPFFLHHRLFKLCGMGVISHQNTGRKCGHFMWAYHFHGPI